MATFPAQASSLRKGGFIVINDCPCKITSMSTSKTGKHGHAKIHFFANDIFTGRKYDYMIGSTHNVDVPNVSKMEYTLCDIDPTDGFVSLMDENGEMKEDLSLPVDNENLKDEIQKAFDEGKEVVCVVQSAMGSEAIIGYK